MESLGGLGHNSEADFRVRDFTPMESLGGLGMRL